MRKLMLVLVATALVVTPLTGAQAASRYKVSASVSEKRLDVDSHDGSYRTTRIKGKVKGGPVKGKKVNIYVTNLNTVQKKRKYLTSAKLSASGKYSKKWKPRIGGEYRIEVVMKAGNGRAEGKDAARLLVFHWPDLRDLLGRTSGVVERVNREPATGAYWRQTLAMQGGSKAVFDTAGYHCFRVNFKIGVSKKSKGRKGTFRVSQGSKVLVKKTMKKGQRYYQLPKSKQRKMRAGQPLVFSISGPSNVRFVLGNPKALCTYPAKGGTPTPR